MLLILERISYQSICGMKKCLETILWAWNEGEAITCVNEMLRVAPQVLFHQSMSNDLLLNSMLKPQRTFFLPPRAKIKQKIEYKRAPQSVKP